MTSSTRWSEPVAAPPGWRGRRPGQHHDRVLTMRLFGAFEIDVDATPIALTSTRAQHLLACVALHPRAPQRRDQLAFRLWPDSTDAQARTNLRHLLHTLRSAVPGIDRHLVTTPQTLTWDGGQVDVTAFLGHLDAASGPDEAAHLRSAVDLYRGDLLEACYDEWAEPERDRLRRLALDALARLVALPRLESDTTAVDVAIGYAERARAMDPLGESVYRSLMALYDARGDRAHALRVYHEGVAVLQEQLGVPPGAQTQSVYAGLLAKPDTAPSRAATPFVGRRTERRQLIELWHDASRGRAQLAFVTGEPGVGKTRLVTELGRWAARRGAVTASARSYTAEGALPYGPVVSWLRTPAVVRRRARLETHQLSELAQLVPEIAGGREPDDPTRRTTLFDAAARALLSGPEPLLLLADNLPAADAQTLQFLHFLLRTEPQAAVLVVGTGRLAETDADDPVHALLAGLQSLGRATCLELPRLGLPETTELVQRMVATPRSAEDLAALHDQTGGNPLFILETVRAGWPTGARADVLTPRVHAVLETRLRQVGPSARDLLGLAAAIGGPIPVDLLEAARDAAPTDDRTGRDLDELWRRQLLLATGPATYDFSHDKLREVAYATLTPAQRRRHHRTLSDALQELHRDRLDDVAARIAAHLDAAGAGTHAVEWYVRAAHGARRVHADADAASLYDRALSTQRSAGPGEEDRSRELDLLAASMGPLAAAEGYGSPRLGVAVAAALELAGELGTAPPAAVLRARAMAVLSRSDFDTAFDLGARLRAGGAAEPTPARRDLLVVEGAFVQGVAAYWRGELVIARQHLELAVAQYRPENRAAHLSAFAQDPQVLALARLAHVDYFSGDPTGARSRQQDSLDRAEDVGHPFTRAVALLFAALLDLELDDLDALRTRVAQLGELRRRLDFPAVRLVTEALQGLLDVVDGDAGAGHARIESTLIDPAAHTAPGVPAMLLRIRLAAGESSGERERVADTARRLLAVDVRVWDEHAHRVLGH